MRMNIDSFVGDITHRFWLGEQLLITQSNESFGHFFALFLIGDIVGVSFMHVLHAWLKTFEITS